MLREVIYDRPFSLSHSSPESVEADREQFRTRLCQVLDRVELIRNPSEGVRGALATDLAEAAGKVASYRIETSQGAVLRLFTTGRIVLSVNWLAGKYYIEIPE